jgi:hypothetical protein
VVIEPRRFGASIGGRSIHSDRLSSSSTFMALSVRHVRVPALEWLDEEA